MKKMKYILSFSIILILIYSCTEKIDIELNDEKNSRLVVDGGITTDTASHTIKLTRTSSYFENQKTPAETNAIVSISDGTNLFMLTETSPGVYRTAPDVAGKFGKTYTLNIELANGEKYEASCKIDTIPAIDLIEYYYHEVYESYIFLLFAQEPEGKGDNYMFNIYLDGKLDNDTLRETSFQGDELFDGMYIPGLEIYYLPENEISKDTTHVKIDMLSMTKAQLDYYLALMMETDWRGGPYDGPPANIPSNISKGALGFFWASGISEFEFDLIRE